MVFDATISLGTLIQTIVIVGGGIAVFWQMKGKVDNMATEIVDIKTDLKELNKVIVKMAVADNRLNNLEEDIRDLKRGKGFIVNQNSKEP